MLRLGLLITKIPPKMDQAACTGGVDLAKDPGRRPGSIAVRRRRLRQRKRNGDVMRSYTNKASTRGSPPKCIHSPVRSVPDSRSCRASVGIQPGQIVPAQRSWSPVRLLGPGYPAPILRTVSPVRLHSPVRPVPASRTCQAGVSIQS